VRLRQRYILGAIMFGSRKPLAVRLSGCQAVRQSGCGQPCWNASAGLSDNGWAWSSCGEVREVGSQTVRGGGQARLERQARRRQRKRACYGRLGVLVARGLNQRREGQVFFAALVLPLLHMST
jgi:hypothetical protein